MEQSLAYLSRSDQLKARVSRLALKAGANGRLPPMRQLSRELGVSLMTLDRTYHELELEGLLIRKHGSGVFVSTDAVLRSVALIHDRDIAGPGISPFCRLLLDVLTPMSQDAGLRLRFYLDAGHAMRGLPGAAELREEVTRGRVAGALYVGRPEGPLVDDLRTWGIPLVTFSETPTPAPWVHLDLEDLARSAVGHLARQSCRRVALLTPWGPEGPGVAAFREALRSAGLSDDPARIAPAQAMDVHAETPVNEESGYFATRALFEGGPRETAPDALVSFDDLMTRGAMAALHRMRIEPARHVRVVSHANGDSPVLSIYASKVVLYEYAPADVARAMMDIVEARMDGRAPSSDMVAVRGRLIAKAMQEGGAA